MAASAPHPAPGAPGLRVVGVLGGVGSGKSTAARALAEAWGPGARVLDADAAVAELLADPEVLDRLEEAAGRPVRTPAGEVDRPALARVLFADPEVRRRVEAVLHPRVRERLRAGLEALEASDVPSERRLAVLDVPLLLEGGLHRLCDFLVFVDAPEAQRAARAGARHGWSEAEWRAREAAQAPLAEKRAAADAILHNEGAPEDLRREVEDLLPRIRALAPRPLSERRPEPPAP